MNLILASDFPSTAQPAIVERIKAAGTDPRIAWIPALTDTGRSRFAEARTRFADIGLDRLEYLDIDEDLDQVQIAYLHEFDVICLTADDPVRFRYNAIRAGLAGRLRQCVTLGRVVVGTSGGALLLTPNVSLSRLQTESVDDVLATRGRFDAIGAVSFEVLPHANRWDEALRVKVQQYSAAVDSDIVAMDDGGAVLASASAGVEHVGTVTIYRRGEII